MKTSFGIGAVHMTPTVKRRGQLKTSSEANAINYVGIVVDIDWW